MRSRLLAALTALSPLFAVPSVGAGALDVDLTPLSPVSWVSTGDSYASGEGVAGNEGACSLTREAYGPAAAQLLRERGIEVPNDAFAACTGHLVEDMFNARPDAAGRESLWWWAEKQGASPRVDVVTLSFGGNDVGFPEILKDCLITPDSWVGFVIPISNLTGCDTSEQEIRARIDSLVTPLRSDCVGGRVDSRHRGNEDYNCTLLLDDQGTEDTIDDERGSLVDFYVKIATEHLTERGVLAVVNYPRLFAPSGEWPAFSAIMCTGVKRGDADRLGRLAEHLNGRIANAVNGANTRLGSERVVLVDRAAEYRQGGHELCGSGDNWLNGISAFRGTDRIQHESSFHPNLNGHQGIADIVADRVVEALSANTTRLADAVAPDDTAASLAAVLGAIDLARVPRQSLADGAPNRFTVCPSTLSNFVDELETYFPATPDLADAYVACEIRPDGFGGSPPSLLMLAVASNSRFEFEVGVPASTWIPTTCVDDWKNVSRDSDTDNFDRTELPSSLYADGIRKLGPNRMDVCTNTKTGVALRFSVKGSEKPDSSDMNSLAADVLYPMAVDHILGPAFDPYTLVAPASTSQPIVVDAQTARDFAEQRNGGELLDFNAQEAGWNCGDPPEPMWAFLALSDNWRIIFKLEEVPGRAFPGIQGREFRSAEDAHQFLEYARLAVECTQVSDTQLEQAVLLDFPGVDLAIETVSRRAGGEVRESTAVWIVDGSFVLQLDGPPDWIEERLEELILWPYS